MARLQKRALYALILCTVWASALVITFVAKGGIDNFRVDRAFEGLMVGIMIAGFAAYALILLATRSSGDDVALDERDRKIVAGARSIQLWASMLTLAAWMISLSEVYWEQGQVPVQYLYIIAMSTWLMVVIGENAGILIGYWRS